MKFGVGQPVRRTEDLRLLTGAGRYTDDIDVPGQVYAYVLRSPHAHAEIGAIDTKTAGAAPGVLAVLTGADVEADGLGDVPCIYRIDNADGSQNAYPPHPMLAKGRVHHVGDAVAVINAIVNALSEYGITHIDMPATPERIWSAIHAAGRI